MLAKSVGVGFIFALAIILGMTWSPRGASAGKLNKPANMMLFSQAPSSSGGLVASAWLAPTGSQDDRFIWDNFTLGSSYMITEIDWIGGYDPAASGAGGSVVDFTVAVYGSIPGGSQPNIVDPPLGTFQTGGNASETPYDTLGGIPMYGYQYVLPTPVIVTGVNVYWLQIAAWQHGSKPDWGMAIGNTGDGVHFLKIRHGLGYTYQFAPSDAAFTLWGQLTPYQYYFPLMQK